MGFLKGLFDAASDFIDELPDRADAQQGKTAQRVLDGKYKDRLSQDQQAELKGKVRSGKEAQNYLDKK
jgi:hypothetical protein